VSLKAPFVWHGGKSRAASLIWERLGDVEVFNDPFVGSCSILLQRPHDMAERRRSETINDADGHLCNVWRSIQMSPKATAKAADWPVIHADLTARHAHLIKRLPDMLPQLRADPKFHDPELAGWWIWGCCLWIGDGWCKSKSGQIPALSTAGQGVHSDGVRKGTIPHLGNAGRGIHGDSVRNVARERKLAGVAATENVTMSVYDWFAALSERLRGVRIVNGDWSQILGSGAVQCVLNCYPKSAHAGIVLDPPYDGYEDTYGSDGKPARDSYEWALANGDDPRLRIAYCAYDGQFTFPDGWECVYWKAKGGYQADTTRERIWFSPHCLGGKQRSLF